MQNISKAGWCSKEGGIIKTVKRRWFILDGNVLHYYTKDGGKEKGTIQISENTKVGNDEFYKIQPCFTISSGKRTYRIFPESLDDRDDWIKVIRKLCDKAYASETDVYISASEEFYERFPMARSAIRRMRAARRHSANI